MDVASNPCAANRVNATSMGSRPAWSSTVARYHFPVIPILLPTIGRRDSVFNATVGPVSPHHIGLRNPPRTAAPLPPSEGSAMTKSRLLAAASASALVVIGLVGCAPPEKESTGNQTESGVDAKAATSAADFGGMDGLVEAAKAEGH